MTMNAQFALDPQSAGIEAGSIDRRRAPWLHSPYSARSWIVSDTRNPDRIQVISFDYRLADGRMLHEAERLHRTVKEYAFWLRDARYSRIDDAFTHKSMVQLVLHLAHALSLRKLQSFRQLQPLDIEELIEECRYGTDGVLRASTRIVAELKRLAQEDAANPKPLGGLPRMEERDGRGRTRAIMARGAFVKSCNLPASAAKLRRVAAILSQAALDAGFYVSKAPPSELPPLQNQSCEVLRRWLETLEQLFAMSRRMEAESITFKPFPYGAGRVAAVKGIATNRTPTPPPRLVIHLLEHSVIWLFDKTKARAIDKGTAGPKAVRLMATACWIIIAAFTARRAEEINDLRNDCLLGDNESGSWLHVYIEKTLQRKEWIPVPRMVVHAVEMLRRISETARSGTQDDKLFQWLSPDGELVRLPVAQHLDNFAALVNVPLHKPRGGEPVAWHWSPHQFRRFFAVFYFYRYEPGNIEALSHHLRHFSLEMTRRYVTEDPEVAALWTDTEWGYESHIARAIVAGERSFSGAAGEKLKKASHLWIDIFRRQLQIATPDRVGASLKLTMQRQGMVLTPKPWVICTCPQTSDAALKAACRRVGPEDDKAIGPNSAQAGPTVCAACPHAMTEGARQPFVEAEVLHLEGVARSRPRDGTIFGELEAARVVEIRHVRDTRYAAAKPLQNAGLEEDEV